MSKRWLREKKRDYYYKKAKEEEYRSRASFKLRQLNERFSLIKRGDKILDLGAAPGGWMQVAREIAGSRGFVLGVDLAKIQDFGFENVKSIQGDFTQKETIENIKEILPGCDVIISDASPDISGVWDIDHFRSVELCRSVLTIADGILKPGGNFLIKIFQGEHTSEFLNEVKKKFGYVKATKPKASRSGSAEIYIAAKGFASTTPYPRKEFKKAKIIRRSTKNFYTHE
ncbi:MAG: RlmE family RNA methyltransferase [Methanobacteriota archaeon]